MNVSIVVPCYNEEKRLNVSEYATYYAARPDISYCFVDDGSRDNTRSVLAELAKGREKRIAVLRLPEHSGKAEAVRAGILHELQRRQLDFVGFLDADLATPLSEIDHLLSCSSDFPASSIVFGSRVKRSGARITRSLMRQYLGRIFAAAVKLFLGIHAYDTQCGAKLIRASVAREIFREPFVSRWIFDVELFLRASAVPGVAPDAFVEVPLRIWTEKGSSRIGMQEAAGCIADFIGIWQRYGKMRSYRSDGNDAT